MVASGTSATQATRLFYCRGMLTLYAPVAGRVEITDAGVDIIVCGPAVACSPGRGRIAMNPGTIVLTDHKERVVEVTCVAPGLTAEPLVSDGDDVRDDQPLFALADGEWRVGVRSLSTSDVLPHVKTGDDIDAGADLLSIGPFACGA